MLQAHAHAKSSWRGAALLLLLLAAASPFVPGVAAEAEAAASGTCGTTPPEEGEGACSGDGPTATPTPPDVAAIMKLGNDAFARGLYGAAVQSYSDALQLGESALLYVKRSAAHMSMHNQAQALRDLDAALELDTKHVQGYISRGKLQKQMCSLAAAERDFKTVLSLRPDHKTAAAELSGVAAVQSALAAVLAAMSANRVPAARAALAKLYELASDCVQAQLMEGKLELMAQDYEQVVAVTGRLLKSNPKHLEALVLRGRAYFYLNDHDMAKRHFGEALKYDPDYKEASTEFGKVKTYDRTRSSAEKSLAARAWQDAEDTFTKCLNLDVNHRRSNAGLWLGLAKARVGQGRHLQAAEAFEAALDLGLDSAGTNEAHTGVVRALLAAQEWQRAVNRAREAVQEDQTNRVFRQLLAEAEKQLKISKRKDYFKVLGLERGASEREVKKAYRELAKKHHPDKVDLDQREAAAKAFHDIAEAAEVLSDPEKRQRWENGEDLEEMERPQQRDPFSHFGGGGFQFRWG